MQFDIILSDDLEKKARSSYFGLPGLDVSVGFPQATPASIFPPCSKKDCCFAAVLCSSKTLK